MRHGDAGLYAVAGAMIVSSGLMAVCYAGLGRQVMPGTTVTDSQPGCDKPTRCVGDSRYDADERDLTIHVVIDDKTGSSDAKVSVSSATDSPSVSVTNRQGSDAGAPESTSVSAVKSGKDETSATDAKSQETSQKKTTPTITDKRVRPAGEKQLKAVKDAIRKSLGDAVPFECDVTTSDWDGGKGYRLVIATYADGKAVKSGKSLSDAFGKLVADMVPVADGQFDDVEIISVMLYGMADSEVLTDLPAYPLAKDMDWVAAASVDIPSVEDGAIGDVNHVSVTYDGKPVSIDMAKHGFSSLPPEE